MNNRVTRSSTRSRLRKPTTSSTPRPNPVKTVNKLIVGNSRQKPVERVSNSSRCTRSTTKVAEAKRRDHRDDEGPRRMRMISVGEKFQAQIPPLDPDRAKPSELPDKETCVWKMNDTQDERKVEQFCIEVYERLGLSAERALYHLYRNKFDYEKAMKSAITSASLEDTWSEDDKYCFYGLFSTYGRDFSKIHQIMAHKSMKAIVEYYYRVKLQTNFASIVDRDNIGYDSNRKISTDEREPDVLRPSVCQNCGTCALLYCINNIRQCLSCKKFFEEFNFNRPMGKQEKPLNLKFAEEIIRMVNDFKEMCEPQSTGRSKCEEIRQNAINSCRLLRAETSRKDVNAGRIVQRLLNEVNLDEYKRLLTSGNAQTRSRITTVWTNNEKNVAVQALIRYGGNREAVATILGTKTVDMVNEFYTKYEQVLNEAIKTKTDTTSERRQQADQDYNEMLTELNRNVEVVELD